VKTGEKKNTGTIAFRFRQVLLYYEENEWTSLVSLQKHKSFFVECCDGACGS